MPYAISIRTLTITMLLLFPTLVRAKRMTYKLTTKSVNCHPSRYSYTGQESELELKNKKEIYNHRARAYDPQLRKFLSPDKAKQQHGAYTYVANNPLNYVDVTGKWFDVQESLEEPKFKEFTKKIIDYLRVNGTKESRSRIEYLFTSPDKISIKYALKNKFVLSYKLDGKLLPNQSRTIFFNPFLERLVFYFSEEDYVHYRSPFISFSHEAEHARNSFNIKKFEEDRMKYSESHENYKWTSKEEYSTIVSENKLITFLQKNTDVEDLAAFLCRFSSQENELQLKGASTTELIQLVKTHGGLEEILQKFNQKVNILLKNTKLRYDLRESHVLDLDPRGNTLRIAIKNGGEQYLPKIKAKTSKLQSMNLQNPEQILLQLQQISSTIQKKEEKKEWYEEKCNIF